MESPRFREDGEDLDFYFQPLPPLAEDEENVSLADILSLRARGLSEQEAWAVGLECGLSLHKVAHAGLFQTLCITPDTLAFDTSGHVSFMEQLSDDPEGAFVPPEFDDTGNTFEAHVYSLGATLKAALDFMGEPEPEPEPRLSHELEALLDRMQALDPRERPDLQSVIVLCEQKLWPVSSCRLCRSLSAVGRRVLSIESFGAFPDISENTWTGRLAPRTVGTRRRPPDPADAGDPQTPSREDPGQPRALKPLFSAPLRNGQSLSLQRLGSLVLSPQPGCPGRSSLRKVRTLSWLLPEAPEAGPTEASPEGRHGHSSTRPQPEPWQGKSGASVQAALEEKVTPAAQHPPKARSAAQSAGAPEGALDSAEDPGSLTEQAVSLQTLLSTLGRPLKEYELWALSHACLSALWTQRQHPAYLCPDSVLVAKDGAVFFRPPPANGAHNAFFLAPEVAEQKLVTEKASVYCMAAVLWTAARFCVPQGQKLALPHRLKALLLDMARCSPRERPAPAEAVKVCGAYLLQRGMDSRKVLAHLLTATCKVDHQEETISLQTSLSPEDPLVAPAHLPSSGFMPIRGDTRLVPCQEPMPGQGATELPLALNSAATDFRPILLSRDIGVAREDPADSPEEHGDWQDEQSKGQWVRGAAPDLESPQLEAASPGQELELRALAPGLPAPSSPPSMAHTPLEHQQEAQPPIAAPHHTLGPQYPEPTASTHAHRPPPAGPPRVTDPPSPGQEPRGPHPASANAESLGDPPHGEQDGQAPSGPPQQPRPAREPSGVDTPAPRGPAGPSLQEAMSLIQEHFASDGYPDNGLETLIMGEYIFGLRDLTFSTFCGAVSEKFCDLFWGEKLLLSLFSVVNGHRTFEESPSQPGPGCTLSSMRTPQLGEGTEQLPAACRDQAPCPPSAPAPVDGLSRGNFEVGFRSQRPVSVQDTRPAVHGEAHPEGSADAGAQPAPPGEARPAAAWSCGPGWGSAFYEADCFGPDVQKYLQDLGVHGATQGAPTSAHSMGLEQQLLMEKRNFRKTLKFYQKLLQKEKRNKGSEVKSMVTRLKGQLEEMRSRVRFLGLVRRYLQVVYAEQWGLEPSMLPVIVHLAGAPCDSLALSPLDESSSLIFYNVSKQVCGGQQSRARVLQAGTPLGLMAYLYSSDAFLEGYVQQFLYTFRYFCTPQDFLHFLLDRIRSALPRAQQDPASTFTRIYKRSLCVLQAWVEDCGALDFAHSPGLLATLRDFLSSQVLPLDSSAEPLLALLALGTERGAEGSPHGADLEAPTEAENAGPLNSLCKRLTEDGLSRKSFPWRLTWGHGLSLPPKERPYTIAAALPRPRLLEEACSPHTKAGEKGPYFLSQLSTQQLSSQLTLLQQELFQKCHPVHFLNSRALGVLDQSAAMPRASMAERPAGACSLFLPGCTQDPFLLQLLRHAEDVTTWVAAEIVTCHGSKLQVSLLSKFLLTAKCCYEQRNFATAMQILGGLEHPAVRRSPAWRLLPAKVAEVLEELKAVEVFLKSDSLCLMEGRRFRAQPTLPSAHLLAMHIQQLETGGFTMTNGAHRWSKLRNIARVASQVQAFQESPYALAPDPKLQAHLRQRMARFSGADVCSLAADPHPGLAPTPTAAGKHTSRLQDKLRRMRATFQ